MEIVKTVLLNLAPGVNVQQVMLPIAQRGLLRRMDYAGTVTEGKWFVKGFAG